MADTGKFNEKDLYCIAQHIRALVEFMNKGGTAEEAWVNACSKCDFALQDSCPNTGGKGLDSWPSFERLSHATGVPI